MKKDRELHKNKNAIKRNMRDVYNQDDFNEQNSTSIARMSVDTSANALALQRILDNGANDAKYNQLIKQSANDVIKVAEPLRKTAIKEIQNRYSKSPDKTKDFFRSLIRGMYAYTIDSRDTEHYATLKTLDRAAVEYIADIMVHEAIENMSRVNSFYNPSLRPQIDDITNEVFKKIY